MLKSFLSLWILLLCVCSQLFAHTHKAAAFHAPEEVYEWSAYASFGNTGQEETFVSKQDSGSAGEHRSKSDFREICEEEVEENESSSFKRRLLSSSYFSAIFYTLAGEYFFRYLKTSLPFCKQFSFTSPHLFFLIFQVFRI